MVAPLAGCCFLVPEWPDCNEEPTGAECFITFIRENEHLCGTQFARNWKVTYDKVGGQRVTVNGDPVAANGQADINIEDAADADGDGEIDYLEVQIYTACDPAQPPEAPISWSSFTLAVDDGYFVDLTMHADGLFDKEEYPEPDDEKAAKKVITKVNQFTGAKIESPKKTPKKKKSCCW
ncbi:MAG TPA: hypothetical protein VFG20_15810 [Planctomycetaceae bacterium]|nr:hypothetical protein [Planctomycetaceae bacterium]